MNSIRIDIRLSSKIVEMEKIVPWKFRIRLSFDYIMRMIIAFIHKAIYWIIFLRICILNNSVAFSVLFILIFGFGHSSIKQWRPMTKKASMMIPWRSITESVFIIIIIIFIVIVIIIKRLLPVSVAMSSSMSPAFL